MWCHMQRVQVFRCMICGDPYIGFEVSSNCPFCGAHERYMVHQSDWKDISKVELTGNSRKNIESSLHLEISNAEFYLCVSRTSRNQEIRTIFRALSRVETEHATIFSKILGKEKPVIELRKGICSTDEHETLKEADRRENRVVSLYTEFLKQATEPRVRELFTALIEIESDHIDLVSKETSAPAESIESEETPPKDDTLNQLDRDETDFYESYKMHED